MSHRQLRVRRLTAMQVLGPSVLLGLAFALASCSISSPLGPIFGAKDDPATTGSIPLRDHRFASNMTDEDWRQAQIATELALNPASGGRAALWTNNETGSQGSITAVSDLATDAGHVCRAFVATVRRGGDSSWYQGRACQAGAGSWQITSSAPWTPPASAPLPASSAAPAL